MKNEADLPPREGKAGRRAGCGVALGILSVAGLVLLAGGGVEGTFGQHGSDYTWGLALGRKGKLALSGSDNGKMFLWDLASREAIRTFANVGPVRSVALSHGERRAASGTYKDLLYLWDVE